MMPEKRCRQELAVVGDPAAPPSFLLPSQHRKDLKPAFCNYSNNPKRFLPAPL